MEVCGDLLDIAGKTEATVDGENIVVTLRGYRLVEGCRAVRSASPKCCTMVGCPVCSLIAAIVVPGTEEATKIEHISVDEKRRILRVILRPGTSLVPAPEGEPHPAIGRTSG